MVKKDKYAKLRGLIYEKFGTQKAFAAAMGLTDCQVSGRMRGSVEWSRKEVEKALTVLDVPAADASLYFF